MYKQEMYDKTIDNMFCIIIKIKYKYQKTYSTTIKDASFAT